MPEFRSWREWDGELRAGHFWTRDLRAARGAGIAPRLPCAVCASGAACGCGRARRTASSASCPKMPRCCRMERFGLKYRGQRLAGATNEVFLRLLGAQREVPQQREQILASQGGACKLCGAPIALGTSPKTILDYF